MDLRTFEQRFSSFFPLDTPESVKVEYLKKIAKNRADSLMYRQAAFKELDAMVERRHR